MNTNTTIYENNSYKIEVDRAANPQIIDLLKQTYWGTEAPLYQHKDIEYKAINLLTPLFFTLKKNNRAIGTCCFSKRKFHLGEKIYDGYYSRYFSIEKDSQGKIFGHALLKNIKTYFTKCISEPSVFFAYIDEANPRSEKLIKNIGFHTIGKFETFAFSRLFPRLNNNAFRISESEKEKVIQLLNKQYENYSFVNFEKLFIHNNYFVYKVNNEIVAGIQANPVHWEVKKLPGISGKLIINILPHLPLISRLFNPKKFKFAAFEGVYIKPGYEKELFLLMENACATLGLYTGMIWLNPYSKLCEELKNKNWGIINKLKDNIPANVVAAFKNISKEDEALFVSKPIYVSAFDLT